MSGEAPSSDPAGATPALPGGDPRPRPQYGEYATPEEQRAAIREPARIPASAPVVPTGYGTHAASAQVGARSPRPGETPRPVRMWDRILTLALLVYGLITVFSVLPQLWDFSEFAQTWMQLAGIEGEFTNVAQGEIWGKVASLVFVAGWLGTALLAWNSLTRRRISWWIPLVGAIVTSILVSVCLTVPLLGDPAVATYISG